MESKREEAYIVSYRIGEAKARIETLEFIIEELFAVEYDSLKYKIRRLSEYEANLLYQEYRKSRTIKSLYEFI
ncbi:MAG TPA: hypothetical protein VIK72_07505 [Clostridiaceae bacterium]